MSKDKDFDYLLILLLVGNTCAQKTVFLKQYTNDFFNNNHLASIGIDFVRKNNKYNK